MKVSVIITTHNEGDEVIRTVESVRDNTDALAEILVIDEASTDGSCDNLGDKVVVIKHKERIGIGFSRNEGAEAATGDVVGFLDAHQRVDKNCFDKVAAAAFEKQAIVAPCTYGLATNKLRGYGAEYRFNDKGSAGYFTYKFKMRQPRDKLSRCTQLGVPGYCFPKSLLPKLHWLRAFRGWGGNEACLTLKAFFSDIDIFNLQDTKCHHLFRSGGFPYKVGWTELARNQNLVARILFDEYTYVNHFAAKLQKVYGKRSKDMAETLLNDAEVTREHMEFQEQKKRPDREFWRGIIRMWEPDCLK